MLRIIDIAAGDDEAACASWLPRAEAVHRQLRPHLPEDYCGRVLQVLAAGARMTLVTDGDAVRGIAIWRVLEKTVSGRELYVDDLVTDAAHRSEGVGRALLAACERHAQALGCAQLTLDSGTARQQAHKFYFREGMVVTSFHFCKSL